MKIKNRMQSLSLKYNITRKKYTNMHKKIAELIKDGTFYELSEKIRKNLLRRLNLLYRRLLKLLSQAKLTTAVLTTAFLILSSNAKAQTFSQQTGANNPFIGVDVGDDSAPAFADIDGDGDLDAFIGELGGNVNYYKNTGTAIAPAFTEQTGTNNPFNTINFGLNSTTTFADVDGDGDMDAFIGEFDGNVNYYKNTGTAIVPTFTEQTGTNNPFNSVDVGSDSAPAFADLDGDGDLDAFIGENDGTINYYKNTGTALAPVFTEQTGTNNPFNGADVGIFSAPAFADLDGDGDLDAFIGEYDGNINYYKNSSTLHIPSFEAITTTNNPFNGIDVGYRATPTFADIDSDGDLDSFIGDQSGLIKYYKNTGNALTPAYSEQAGTNNPFDGIDFGSNSISSFVDIDGDGDLDGFIGKSGGTVRYFKNTGTKLVFAFTELTGTNNPLSVVSVGNYSAPIFVDIDSDGDLDVFSGDFNSLGVHYYENTGTALAPAFTEKTGTNNPLNGITVSTYAKPNFADLDGDGDVDAFIGGQNGQIIYCKNTGTALVPGLTLQTGTNSPFNDVNLGSYSAISFADLDGDGDLDAFIGAPDGTVRVYADGTNALPVELTTFSASVSSEGVTLLWNTATEVNNYGFEIERSPSSTTPVRTEWTKIGFIPGNGNSNIPHNYAFIDKDILGGTKFNYRLKQLDIDGKFEYSDILTVTLTTPEKAELMQNSPNPFNPSTSIKFFIPNDADVTIKIYDLRGSEVQTLIQEKTTAGFHIVFWNGRNSRGELSASGVYFYRLSTNVGFIETKKMVLLK